MVEEDAKWSRISTRKRQACAENERPHATSSSNTALSGYTHEHVPTGSKYGVSRDCFSTDFWRNVDIIWFRILSQVQAYYQHRGASAEEGIQHSQGTGIPSHS